MRTLVVVAVALALALSAKRSTADFPLALDTQIGLGIGLGSNRGSNAGPFGAFAAVDVTIARGRATRWFVSGIVLGVGAPGGHTHDYRPDLYRLDSIALESLIAGVEHSRNDGGAFVRLGAG